MKPCSRHRWPLLATLALAAACRSATPAPNAPAVDWELRSFEVASQDREPVAEVLSSLLKDKGRVRIGPDGRLIVLAAPSTHRQIQEEILAPLAKGPPALARAKKPVSLTMTYWMLLARPRRTGGATATQAVPAVQEIAGVLPEIEKATGPADLELLERLRLTSSDVGAETSGRMFHVKQRPSLVAGQVVSDLGLTAFFQRGEAVENHQMIATRVSLEPGQVAVVGELGVQGNLRGLPRQVRPPEAGDTLFLVIKASVDGAVAQK